ncbi:glycine-rich domain-containing protein [Zoogloea dura]|uniref:glycine-rich domain-containing protein n=1 Tax=Zoogloea dura TaxID=2728840 RepID=UPI00197DFB93|nr:hypothetical protein [Zoogloea dura]
MRGLNGSRRLAIILLGAVALAFFIHAQPDANPWIPRLLLGGSVLILFGLIWRSRRQGARARFLARFRFPSGLARKVRERYPHLSEAQAEMVVRELRNFFRVALAAQGRMVSMPSQAVDVAWHEFILFTKGYRLFCRQGLGRFLDHTPAEYMATPQTAQTGLRRTWLQACRLEGIDPRKPARLPMLFALDGLLLIPDGFRYALNCMGPDGTRSGDAYCATDMGCGGSGSGCAGDSDGAGGGGGGDGAGDGGSGCGGGCGGGD